MAPVESDPLDLGVRDDHSLTRTTGSITGEATSRGCCRSSSAVRWVAPAHPSGTSTNGERPPTGRWSPPRRRARDAHRRPTARASTPRRTDRAFPRMSPSPLGGQQRRRRRRRPRPGSAAGPAVPLVPLLAPLEPFQFTWVVEHAVCRVDAGHAGVSRVTLLCAVVGIPVEPVAAHQFATGDPDLLQWGSRCHTEHLVRIVHSTPLQTPRTSVVRPGTATPEREDRPVWQPPVRGLPANR